MTATLDIDDAYRLMREDHAAWCRYEGARRVEALLDIAEEQWRVALWETSGAKVQAEMARILADRMKSATPDEKRGMWAMCPPQVKDALRAAAKA